MTTAAIIITYVTAHGIGRCTFTGPDARKHAESELRDLRARASGVVHPPISDIRVEERAARV